MEEAGRNRLGRERFRLAISLRRAYLRDDSFGYTAHACLGCCYFHSGGRERATFVVGSNGKSRQKRFDHCPDAGELFAALGKSGKNKTGQLNTAPNSRAYANRPQIALNLGGLNSDGSLPWKPRTVSR